MEHKTWVDSRTHYQATGYVDSSGKMTDAEVTDNNGITRDRNRTFASESEFSNWARRDAGMS